MFLFCSKCCHSNHYRFHSFRNWVGGGCRPPRSPPPRLVRLCILSRVTVANPGRVYNSLSSTYVLYTRLKKRCHVKTINHALTMIPNRFMGRFILSFAYSNTRLSFVRLVGLIRVARGSGNGASQNLKAT